MEENKYQTKLMEYLEDGKLELFTSLLKTHKEDINPNHLYSQSGYKTCLAKASSSNKKEISAKFIRVLLENGADPNVPIKIHECYTALHFAAEKRNFEALDELLKHSNTDPNAITTKGKTAIYLAARSLENAEDNDKLEAEQCFQRLAMYHKTDIRRDISEMTAIGEAAKHGCNNDLLREVMERFKYLKTEDRKQINLENNFPDLDITMYKDETTNITATELYIMLKNQDCETFKATLTTELMRSENTLPMTFLQYSCQFEDLFPVVQHLVNLNVNLNAKGQHEEKPPVNIASYSGNFKALKLLVESGARVETVNQKTLFHEVLEGLSTKKRAKGQHRECFDCLLDKNDAETNPLNIPINVGDFHGHTALHYAVLEEDTHYAKGLLKHGAYLGALNNFSVSPLHDMEPELLEEVLDNCIERKQNDKETNVYTLQINFRNLNPHYGNCFKDCKVTSTTGNTANTSNGNSRETNFTNPAYNTENAHTVDMEEKAPLNVMDPKKQSTQESRENSTPILPEMYPLYFISHSKKLRHLLKHPVFLIFLHLKWTRISIPIILNICFYTLFVLCLTIYLASCNCNGSGLTTYECDPQEIGKLWYVVFVLTVCLVVREIMQFAMLVGKMKMQYIKDLENWIEFGIIITTITILSGYCSNFLMAVTFLLSWTEMILQCSCFPKPAVYNEMMKRVTINYLKFLFWYSPLIVAFTLSFYKLYNMKETSEQWNGSFLTSHNVSGNFSIQDDDEEVDFYSDFSLSFLKTVVMMIGEFDASGMAYSTGSKVIFLFFVFMITIVLLNLLNGLAISDTREIFDEAEIVTHRSRARSLHIFESALFGEPRGDGEESRSYFKSLQKVVILFPDTFHNDCLFITLKQNTKIGRYADPRNMKLKMEYRPDRCFQIMKLRFGINLGQDVLSLAKSIADRAGSKSDNIEERMERLEQEIKSIKELIVGQQANTIP